MSEDTKSAKRIMDEDFARRLLRQVEAVQNELREWLEEHPTVADYRVNDAMESLREADNALEHLERNEHYAANLTFTPLVYPREG